MGSRWMPALPGVPWSRCLRALAGTVCPLGVPLPLHCAFGSSAVPLAKSFWRPAWFSAGLVQDVL